MVKKNHRAAAEGEAGLRIPAIYANRFYAYSADGNTRFSLGEVVADGDTNFHTAIFMTNESARLFIDLITRLINEDEARRVATAISLDLPAVIQ